jgi:hypothetical protein
MAPVSEQSHCSHGRQPGSDITPLSVSVVERGAGASSFPVSQKVLIAKAG